MSPIATTEQIYRLLESVIPSKGPNDYGVLATTGPEGLACARFVVLRGFNPDTHQLWINTNIKTEKVAHLRHWPDAEVALWLSRKKIQLRLRAEWRVVDAALAARTPPLAGLRAQAWAEQPAATKRMYTWPKPGQTLGRRKPAAEELEMFPEDLPHPDFAVLLGTLYRIDALRLVRPYHQRYVHDRPRNTWQTTRMTA